MRPCSSDSSCSASYRRLEHCVQRPSGPNVVPSSSYVLITRSIIILFRSRVQNKLAYSRSKTGSTCGTPPRVLSTLGDRLMRANPTPKSQDIYLFNCPSWLRAGFINPFRDGETQVLCAGVALRICIHRCPATRRGVDRSTSVGCQRWEDPGETWEASANNRRPSEYLKTAI